MANQTRSIALAYLGTKFPTCWICCFGLVAAWFVAARSNPSSHYVAYARRACELHATPVCDCKGSGCWGSRDLHGGCQFVCAAKYDDGPRAVLYMSVIGMAKGRS